MRLQFANAEISEYAEGNFHVKNEGQTFEVDALLARELLFAKAAVAGGEFVNVFEPAVGEPMPPEGGTQSEETETDYPEDFPAADVLTELGITHEEVLLLTREQLIDLKGIGPKTADAILAFHTLEA